MKNTCAFTANDGPDKTIMFSPHAVNWLQPTAMALHRFP